MTYIPAALRRLVIERASMCCEYCRLAQDYAFLSHEIDHIISEKHQGKTSEDNLCLSCFDCNRYKGSDVGSVDQPTGELTWLYNPRRMIWEDHFVFDGVVIVPRTATGRVTVYLLHLNDPDRLELRDALHRLGHYPC
jgi:hypothetical protein